MSNNSSKITLLCKKLASEGGVMAQERAANLTCTQKLETDLSYLALADIEIEKHISQQIKASFLQHLVKGEENPEAGKGEYEWYIDPIDGTSNFSFGIPLYATMIGVIHNQEVISSAIYNPVLNKLYWAQKDLGAFINDQRLIVSG